MREDRYDDPAFFAKYSQMPRSQYGLEAAGEWETLRTLLPDFAGRRVLDLGCGYGWHCIYALEHGAAAVTGVDISEKMLAVAREKTGSGDVRYIRAAMEDVDFPDAAFDVALSSLALHYVADFGGMAEKVYRWLAPGGDVRLFHRASHLHRLRQSGLVPRRKGRYPPLSRGQLLF